MRKHKILLVVGILTILLFTLLVLHFCSKRETDEDTKQNASSPTSDLDVGKEDSELDDEEDVNSDSDNEGTESSDLVIEGDGGTIVEIPKDTSNGDTSNEDASNGNTSNGDTSDEADDKSDSESDNKSDNNGEIYFPGNF